MSQEQYKLILSKCVGKLVQAKGFDSVQNSALDTLTNVSEFYMEYLLENVKKFAHLGNRTKANLQDVEQTLNQLDINWQELELSATNLLNITPLSALKVPKPPLPRPFQPRNGSLDPPKKIPAYIPPHLPTFPDEYTFKDTATYPQRLSDPSKIREVNAEQTRLVEENLKRLLFPKAQMSTHSQSNLLDDDSDLPCVNYSMSKFYHINKGSNLKSL